MALIKPEFNMPVIYLEPGALLFITEKDVPVQIRLKSDGEFDVVLTKPADESAFEVVEQDGITIYIDKKIGLASDRQIVIDLKNGLFGRSLAARVTPLTTGPGFMGTHQ
ncbi:MAG: hypothetical protein EA364_16335 [Balneolaceae bacterium]|nr:MAG: hypothetical protein EA364_16335 [Balneolaceae bacterium]